MGHINIFKSKVWGFFFAAMTWVHLEMLLKSAKEPLKKSCTLLVRVQPCKRASLPACQKAKGPHCIHNQPWCEPSASLQLVRRESCQLLFTMLSGKTGFFYDPNINDGRAFKLMRQPIAWLLIESHYRVVLIQVQDIIVFYACVHLCSVFFVLDRLNFGLNLIP